jgi:hypothetical protein
LRSVPEIFPFAEIDDSEGRESHRRFPKRADLKTLLFVWGITSQVVMIVENPITLTEIADTKSAAI